jgi:hypothetical protein
MHVVDRLAVGGGANAVICAAGIVLALSFAGAATESVAALFELETVNLVAARRTDPRLEKNYWTPR